MCLVIREALNSGGGVQHGFHRTSTNAAWLRARARLRLRVLACKPGFGAGKEGNKGCNGNDGMVVLVFE